MELEHKTSGCSVLPLPPTSISQWIYCRFACRTSPRRAESCMLRAVVVEAERIQGRSRRGKVHERETAALCS